MTTRPLQFCAVQNCGKSFDRPAKLRDHMRVHTGEKPFACTSCGKEFSQKKHCQVHELSHLNDTEKPFSCQFCQKRFTLKHHYNKHIQTHNQKVLKCTLCPRTFTQLKSYEAHLKKHETCSQCGKVCKHAKHLAKHKLKRHSLAYPCDNCTRKFESKKSLHNHKEIVHKINESSLAPSVALITGLSYDRRIIACPKNCGRKFTRQYDLQRHKCT